MNSKENSNINPIIIFGSSRHDGQTQQAIRLVTQEREIPLIKLSEYNIAYYDYGYANQNDDFIPLAEKMVNHNPIILATPVYWYSVSAIMKTFIDRWSDLLDVRKDLGRRLIGKELWIITSYAGEMPRSFEEAISQTCDYFKMQYRGCFYYYSGENEVRKKQNTIDAKAFASKIWHADGS